MDSIVKVGFRDRIMFQEDYNMIEMEKCFWSFKKNSVRNYDLHYADNFGLLFTKSNL